MRYWIEVHGAVEAARNFLRFARALGDLRPFWRSRVAPLFSSWMRQQFETAGGFGGARWAPLSPAYAVAKAARHPGRSILIAEGDLRERAMQPRYQATPSALTLTIADRKAGWHQRGTDDMPPRPLIPNRLPAIALRELQHEQVLYLEQEINRAGL